MKSPPRSGSGGIKGSNKLVGGKKAGGSGGGVPSGMGWGTPPGGSGGKGNVVKGGKSGGSGSKKYPK